MITPICAFVKFFTGVQVSWQGSEPAMVQRIYFSNHSSHFDCLLLLSALPRDIRKTIRPAGAADYWTVKPIRNWFSHDVMHMIAIERSKLTKTNNPIKVLLEAVDNGNSLIIFPEGQRGHDKNLQEFKSGLYHLAKRRPNIELVPVYIENANRILPKGARIPIPVLCSVKFGEPIHLLPTERREEFLERARFAVLRCAS